MKVYGLFEESYPNESILLGLYFSPEDAEEDKIKSLDGELISLEVKGKDKAFEAFKESARTIITEQAEHITELFIEIDKLKKENKNLVDQINIVMKVGGV